MEQRDLSDIITIENKALLYLSTIMQAHAKAHRMKELAVLSKSERAFRHFFITIDTLVGLVGTKTLKKEGVKSLEEIRQGLESLEGAEESVEKRIVALRSILEDVEAIIRTHKWFDMPRFGGGGSMSLIDEFYGGEGKHE